MSIDASLAVDRERDLGRRRPSPGRSSNSRATARASRSGGRRAADRARHPATVLRSRSGSRARQHTLERAEGDPVESPALDARDRRAARARPSAARSAWRMRRVNAHDPDRSPDLRVIHAPSVAIAPSRRLIGRRLDRVPKMLDVVPPSTAAEDAREAAARPLAVDRDARSAAVRQRFEHPLLRAPHPARGRTGRLHGHDDPPWEVDRGVFDPRAERTERQHVPGSFGQRAVRALDDLSLAVGAHEVARVRQVRRHAVGWQRDLELGRGMPDPAHRLPSLDDGAVGRAQ